MLCSPKSGSVFLPPKKDCLSHPVLTGGNIENNSCLDDKAEKRDSPGNASLSLASNKLGLVLLRF